MDQIHTPYLSLDELRNAINSVDSEIVTLLKKRMTLAKQVGELKSRSQLQSLKSYLRPGREAAVIRKAIEHNTQDFPDSAIYAIWRQIMASCVHNEQPLTLLAYAPNGDDLSTHLARAYFGEFPQLIQVQSISDLLKTIQEKRTHIGIIPLLSKGWWRPLKEVVIHDIYIFAHLPFVSSGDTPCGVALTTIDLEKTGNDTSICVLSFSQKITPKNRETLSGVATLLDEEETDLLITLNGFHMHQEDELFDKIKKMIPEISTITPLGSYASPIRTPL